jgi:hypothetical protein
MKKMKMFLLTIAGVTLMGCSGQFWGGAAGGAVGAGAGYEYNANKEMKRIDAALKDGKMTQQEYDIRKNQIERMSIIK